MRVVQKFGWSRAELLCRIESTAHTEMTLDIAAEVCYTNNKNTVRENFDHAEDTLCVSEEHLPQFNGEVCDEESGKERRSVRTIPDRVNRNLIRRRSSV